MTADTENLVLELLRGMRADMEKRFTAIDRRFDGIDKRFDGIDERIEAIGTQLEGIRYVLVASVGSIATDLKDHEARIAILEAAEGARV